MASEPLFLGHAPLGHWPTFVWGQGKLSVKGYMKKWAVTLEMGQCGATATSSYM